MSHTYVQNIMHIVFSTKERRKLIPKDMKDRLWSYMAGICKAEAIFVHAVGGMEDHVHLLAQIPATKSVADTLRVIKTNSSWWMRQEQPKFAWQTGYSAFSVSKSKISTVVRYIRKQEKHHKKMTFEEEIFALLKKHEMKFDPKYVLG